MSNQLDFGLLAPEFRRRSIYQARAERLITHVRRICDHYGHDVVADVLRSPETKRKRDAARSFVTNAIHEDPAKRHRCYFRLGDVPMLVAHDPYGGLKRELATLDVEANPAETVVCIREAMFRLYGQVGANKLDQEAERIRAERRCTPPRRGLLKAGAR